MLILLLRTNISPAISLFSEPYSIEVNGAVICLRSKQNYQQISYKLKLALFFGIDMICSTKSSVQVQVLARYIIKETSGFN